MKIAILKETQKFENRVSATPETVKKYNDLGLEVLLERGAGDNSFFSDAKYEEAGAKIIPNRKKILQEADIVFSVNPIDDVSDLKKDSIYIAKLDALINNKVVETCAKSSINAFSLELLPRISRAQSMDILSSQSNLAGYKAVVDAASEFSRAMPMMMTAAGTVAPARVLVLGAGVAGLQAIATAKRLGAVVYAFDVRPAVKEQVESLGGKFVEVETNNSDSETTGGYAKEMTEDYKKRQAEAIAAQIKKADIVITTALIPGKPAPVLITEEMVKTMKPGSVIVDLAVIAGGNCPLSEMDKVIEKHNVKLIGHSNLPGRLAGDASNLLAKNYYNFFMLLWDKDNKNININFNDEIIKGTCITHKGEVVNDRLKK
jgi:NAD(P) transhydrogenase subunit alpha